MLTVCCVLWTDPEGKCNHIYRYGRAHVVALKSAVALHLTIPHEFVCVTNMPGEIEGVCRTVPLDMSVFVPGTRYAKLMLFRRDIADILGARILYLDLDCVPTGSLDEIAGRTEPLVLWRNPRAAPPKRSLFNSSIMLLDAGVRPDIYETFDRKRHPKLIRQETTATDQAWLSRMVADDTPYWDDRDGIYHARRPKDPVGVEDILPENARIVFFAGKREPMMPEIREQFPWIATYSQ